MITQRVYRTVRPFAIVQEKKLDTVCSDMV